MEAILNSSFDWDGSGSYVFATENDSLNGASMLFGYLLTNTAQVFADVRTILEPGSGAPRDRHALEGRGAGGVIHLINSGAASLDAAGGSRRDGKTAMKPFWEIGEDEVKGSLEATTWLPGRDRLTSGVAGFSSFLSLRAACR